MNKQVIVDVSLIPRSKIKHGQLFKISFQILSHRIYFPINIINNLAQWKMNYIFIVIEYQLECDFCKAYKNRFGRQQS